MPRRTVPLPNPDRPRVSLTGDDLRELARQGISEAEALRQIGLLRNPKGAIRIERPATPGDGLLQLDRDRETELEQLGRDAAEDGRVMKFVPASGAATRMFAPLREAIDKGDDAVLERFLSDSRLPFPRFAGSPSAPGAASPGEQVQWLLHARPGPALAGRAKGLIPFHREGERVLTPFEEQLIEAASYSRSRGGVCRIHFTVGADQRDAFEDLFASRRGWIEETTDTRLEVNFSHQYPSSDTLTLTAAGELLRSPDGKLQFRPGGHGALLRNLGESRGDLVVIKNIDNVLPSSRRAETTRWKRNLIGILVEIEREVARFLHLVTSSSPEERSLQEAAHFSARTLMQPLPPHLVAAPSGERAEWLARRLARPLRVCGMVKNQGEPGGGPFWVRGPDGSASLQIVEASEIERRDPEQLALFSAATHFNPVDIVCSLRDWKGRPYDLQQFVDQTTAFVSQKQIDGETVAVLEHPGLWNGSMAGWNTIFVEVPASTFAPVKTVFDLLRPEHQQ